MYSWENQSIDTIHSAEQLSNNEKDRSSLFDPKGINLFMKTTKEDIGKQGEMLDAINNLIAEQNNTINHHFDVLERESKKSSFREKWTMIFTTIGALAAIAALFK